MTLAELQGEALGCTRCPLAGGRTNVVFGVGNPDADLMFVGEGPGEQEDLKGEPFVGRSGKLLDQLMFEELGITRAECYIGNVVKCRPPGNRDPRPEEIEACRPYLESQLELIDPKVVITLGNFATKLLLNTTEGINRMRGRVYPFRRGVLVPTYHPAALLRSGGDSVAKMRADLVRAKQFLEGTAGNDESRRAVREAPTPSGGVDGGAKQFLEGTAGNEESRRAVSEAPTPSGGVDGGAKPPRLFA